MTKEASKEPPALAKVTAIVRKLMQEQFFGEVGITFQNGKPHTVKVHRTYKVEDL